MVRTPSSEADKICASFKSGDHNLIVPSPPPTINLAPYRGNLKTMFLQNYGEDFLGADSIHIRNERIELGFAVLFRGGEHALSIHLPQRCSDLENLVFENRRI